MGIAPEERDQIFGPFTQGKAVPPREGLGLGLAIAREIVEGHAGEIEVTSKGVGQGATFRVFLKRLRNKPTRKPGPEPPASSDGHPAPNGPGKRILYVEDHAETARAVAMLLEAAGHHVTVADSVAGAVARADQAFDVVVSDIGLPDGSGYDLMRRVRAVRGIPGIAITGYGTSEDRDRSRAAGFEAHLVKPFDVEKLLRLIERIAKRA